jgi:hypothetical protein
MLFVVPAIVDVFDVEVLMWKSVVEVWCGSSVWKFGVEVRCGSSVSTADVVFLCGDFVAAC